MQKTLLPLFAVVALLLPLTTVDASQAPTAPEQVEQDPVAQLSPYFFAAARQNDSEVLDAFLQAGFPVDLVNNQSYTALMIAAYAGSADAVESLLNHGANACLRDKRGNTALLGALIKAEVRIARTLYAEQCEDKPNKAGLELSEFAAMFGQSDVLLELQQHAANAGMQTN